MHQFQYVSREATLLLCGAVVCLAAIFMVVMLQKRKAKKCANILGLVENGRPVPPEIEPGSQEHLEVPGAPYGCRYCGRCDLQEPYCPNGCGHSWIVDLNQYRRNDAKA